MIEFVSRSFKEISKLAVFGDKRLLLVVFKH